MTFADNIDIIGVYKATRNKGKTMDITTIAMLAAILIPLAMIGVGDAKRHPLG